MEELKITSEELSKMQELGRGACSTVYRYNDDLVIKVLNDKGIELHNEENFSDILGIKNDTCIFPQNRVEVDGLFKGYTMEYIRGIPLHEIIKKLDIQTLISAIQKVEEDLEELSSEKILFQDLNQGGLMWDETQNRIKIIDTDFFEKNESIEKEQCYSTNISSFYSMIEMELGLMSAQDTEISEYLQKNPEFSKLYTKYIQCYLTGDNLSITELIKKAVEIFEKEFKIKANSIQDMQQLIRERTGISEDTFQQEIPIFEPPAEESYANHKGGIKQRIINFIAERPLLRKIPFINRLISREQKVLPETKDTRTEQRGHDSYVSELSNNGQYKNFPPIKEIPVQKRNQRQREGR